MSIQVDKNLEVKIYIYYEEFRRLISACGWVSYYWNMQNGIQGKVSKVQHIAEYYDHNERYYSEQLNEWRFKAERSFEILVNDGKAIGVDNSDIVKKDFLNSLVYDADRRSSYKRYIDTRMKRHEALNIQEIENLYLNKVRKRKK